MSKFTVLDLKSYFNAGRDPEGWHPAIGEEVGALPAGPQTFWGIPFELDPGEPRARSQTTSDAVGQVFATTTYEVDPSDGTLGDSLTSRNWYDLRGNLIKSASPSGLLNKTSYDGVGRPVRQSMSIDAAETSWDDAHDLAGDTVIE